MNYLQAELNSLIKQDDDIFEFLQNSALDGLWYWDLENMENEWMNNRFWETLGYDPEKMPHKAAAWQDIINEDDLQLAFVNFGKHKEDPTFPYDQIVRYKHSDGSTVWIRCRGLIIRDEKGEALRMLGAHTDVTKEKESEVRLKNRVKRYDQIIDGSDLATWEWDIATGKLTTNEYWAKLLKYEPSEVDEKEISFWSENIHPDDKEEADKELIRHFKEEIPSFDCEMRLKGKNGEWVWTKCKGKVTVRDENGRAELMTGYHEDIGERKKSSRELKRYKELLDKTNEVARIGTWEVDLSTQSVYWSEVTHQIHEVPEGYAPELESGINFYKEGVDRDLISEEFGKAVSDGISFDLELRIITSKEKERWVRTIGIPVKTAGEVTSVYGVFQDITALKNAQMETERLLQVKREQNERLINFSHIVSHNLRSHSVNLSMLVNQIDKKKPEITKNRYFEMLRKSTENLVETIKHLNEVASMNSTTSEGMERVLLDEYVGKAIGNVEPSLMEANGKIKNTIKKNVIVNAIPAYLDSILLNLLTNAIKYRSPDRPLEVKISATRIGEEVIISVTDNGLGIDLEKYQQKLFGMYKVFHNNKDARGIGLFITKSQVEAMDGRVAVKSKVNEGSTFKVVLKR